MYNHANNRTFAYHHLEKQPPQLSTYVYLRTKVGDEIPISVVMVPKIATPLKNLLLSPFEHFPYLQGLSLGNPIAHTSDIDFEKGSDFMMYAHIKIKNDSLDWWLYIITWLLYTIHINHFHMHNAWFVHKWQCRDKKVAMLYHYSWKQYYKEMITYVTTVRGFYHEV